MNEINTKLKIFFPVIPKKNLLIKITIIRKKVIILKIVLLFNKNNIKLFSSMLYINPETKDNKRKIIVKYNSLTVIFSLSYSDGNIEINFIFFLSTNFKFFSSKNTEIEVKTENVRRE